MIRQSRLVIHEVIISVFLLMTAPVVTMMIMRAAVYRDLRARRGQTGATEGDVYSLADGTDSEVADSQQR